MPGKKCSSEFGLPEWKEPNETTGFVKLERHAALSCYRTGHGSWLDT